MTLRYGSVCSGIEAASVAWGPLGWTPAFFSEIEKFPSAVLSERFGSNMPGQRPSQNAPPNLGDFTKIGEEHGPIDLLVGGTPCQTFSIAGKRGGLDDPRGELTFEYACLARRLRARWIVWENVPGVLSIDGGWTFGQILAWFAGLPAGSVFEPPGDGWKNSGIVEAGPGEGGRPGFGIAYAVRNAQFFGVPQRRRRVFVIGYSGDWRPAAAVLFEPESLRGDPAPGRETGQGVAGTLAASLGKRGGVPQADNVAGGLIDCTPDGIAGTVSSKWSKGAGGPAGDERYNLIAAPVTTSMLGDRGDTDANESHLVAHSLRGEGFDASEDGTGRGTPLVPVSFGGRVDTTGFQGDDVVGEGDVWPALSAQGGNNGGGAGALLAFTCKDHGADAAEDIAPTLRAMGHGESHANAGGQIAIAIQERAVSENLENGPGGKGFQENIAYTLEARNKVQPVAMDEPMAVRRLTPRECERLQGFPDDWTQIPWRGKRSADCPDGPRYKACGNSMAVPVMRWIGERIDLFEREVHPVLEMKGAAE